jgi:hypothetical protein
MAYLTERPDGFNCTGRGPAHCCWVAGRPCTHLRDREQGDAVPDGRRYACGLLVELGSWERVHADPRYLAEPRAHWDRTPGFPDCGDWYPEVGVCCDRWNEAD